LLQLLPGAVATTFAPIFGVGGIGGQKLERTLGVLTCECADIDSDGCELAGERVPDFALAIAVMQKENSLVAEGLCRTASESCRAEQIARQYSGAFSRDRKSTGPIDDLEQAFAAVPVVPEGVTQEDESRDQSEVA